MVYVKPVVIKLGSLSMIKGNATGPQSDGRRGYSGFFK